MNSGQVCGDFFVTLLFELWFDDANNYVELIFGLKRRIQMLFTAEVALALEGYKAYGK